MTKPDLAKLVSWVEGCLSTKALHVSRLAGGRNNRVYRVDSRKGAFVLKVYFQHPGDRRNRRKAEFHFVSFLWEQGFRQIPRPVATCPRLSASVFRFLRGDKMARGMVGPVEVGALARFLVVCWRQSRGLSPSAFPSASEACFSIRDFEEILRARIRRALRGPNRALRNLILREIRPTLRAAVLRAAASVGKKDLGRSLSSQARILSPADHGFQNCLRAGKRLAFLDFEYAGWDDPATVISNACLHPGIPMPRKYQARFVRSVMRGIGAGRKEWLRLRLIYPLQALKWALILLNPVLSVGRSRRRFAGAEDAHLSHETILARVRRQVGSAREAMRPGHWLDRINSGLAPSCA